MSRIQEDPRIDPRIKQVFGAFPAPVNPGDATSREQLVEEANSEEAAAMRQRWDAFLERCDTDGIAPSAGLAITTRKLASEPDLVLHAHHGAALGAVPRSSPLHVAAIRLGQAAPK